MRLFAIRKKSTGHFLQQKEYGQPNKAFTWDEPREGGIPRLFKTRVGAERALAFWLRGRVYPTRYRQQRQVIEFDNNAGVMRLVDPPAGAELDGPVPMNVNRRRRRRKIGIDPQTKRIIYGEQYETTPRYVEPVPERSADDMEVVEFNMAEVRQVQHFQWYPAALANAVNRDGFIRIELPGPDQIPGAWRAA